MASRTVTMTVHGEQGEVAVLAAGLQQDYPQLRRIAGAPRPGPKATEHYEVELDGQGRSPQPVKLAAGPTEGIGVELAGNLQDINEVLSWISRTFVCDNIETNTTTTDLLTFVVYVDRAPQ